MFKKLILHIQFLKIRALISFEILKWKNDFILSKATFFIGLLHLIFQVQKFLIFSSTKR